jgi:hypothetical protein
MSASLSPDPGASDSKSPLSALNLGFLKNLTDKKTTRGQHVPACQATAVRHDVELMLWLLNRRTTAQTPRTEA